MCAAPPNVTVYVGSVRGDVYAINELTGTTRWICDALPLRMISSPDVGANGAVFMAAYDEFIVALTDSTVLLLWGVATRGIVCSSAAMPVGNIAGVARIRARPRFGSRTLDTGCMLLPALLRTIFASTTLRLT